VNTQANDPRPRLVATDGGHALAGWICASCAHPLALPRPRCPRCTGELVAREFGPFGTVWAATVVRVPIPGLEPPYGLAYVDIDEGPRILVHSGEGPLAIGSRVRLEAPDDNGNPRAVPA
jgi:uncharacterized OB-fold protein